MQKQTITDEIDAKILTTLLLNSRTSFVEIARDCKISAVAVRARYKNLWKAGIIVEEIMQINPICLGYHCVCDFVVLINSQHEKEAKQFLKARPYIADVFENIINDPDGTLSIPCVAAFHDVEELSRAVADLEGNQLIKHVNTLLWANFASLDYVENLIIKPLTEKKKMKSALFDIKIERIEMDEKDRKIAEILAQNSRTSFRKIGEQLGISTKNVTQRYEKLKGTLFIRSTLRVNLSKLGYSAMMGVLINIKNRSETPEIIAQIAQIPNAIAIANFIGNWDLFVDVALENFQDLFKIRKMFFNIKGIARAEFNLTAVHNVWPPYTFASLIKSKINSIDKSLKASRVR